MNFKRILNFCLLCLFSLTALSQNNLINLSAAAASTAASLDITYLGKLGENGIFDNKTAATNGDTIWVAVEINDANTFLSDGISAAEVAFDYDSNYLAPDTWEATDSSCRSTNQKLWGSTDDYSIVTVDDANLTNITLDEREYPVTEISNRKMAVISAAASGSVDTERKISAQDKYLFQVPFKLKQNLPDNNVKLIQLALSPETFSVKSKDSKGQWAKTTKYNFGNSVNLKENVFHLQTGFIELSKQGVAPTPTPTSTEPEGDYDLILTQIANSKAVAGKPIDPNHYKVVSKDDSTTIADDLYDFYIDDKLATSYPAATVSKKIELTAKLKSGNKVSNKLRVDLWVYKQTPAVPILERSRVDNLVKISNNDSSDLVYAVLASGTSAEQLPDAAWKKADSISISVGDVVVAKALGDDKTCSFDSGPTAASNAAPASYTAYIDVQGKIAGSSLGKYYVNPKESVDVNDIKTKLTLTKSLSLYTDRYMSKTPTDSKLVDSYTVPAATEMRTDDTLKIPYVQLWYLEEFSINKVLLSKYVAGYEVGPGVFEFRAGNGMNRAEFAVLMSRILSIPMQDESERKYAPDMVFADEDSIPSWAKQNVKFLVELGVIGGYDEDGQKYFKPLNVLKRSELVKIIAAVEGLVEPSDAEIQQLIKDDPSANFKDVDGHWAARYIYALKKKGVVGGYLEDDKWLFKPENLITRAEVVTIIDRMLEAKNLVTNVSPSDVDENFWAYGQIRRAMNERSL